MGGDYEIVISSMEEKRFRGVRGVRGKAAGRAESNVRDGWEHKR